MTKTVLTVLFCLGALTLAEAQIGNRIRNRINSRVNQEVDRAVDKAIDEALTPEEQAKADSTATASDARPTTDSMGVNYGNAAVSEGEWEAVENTSPMSFDMEVTTTKRNKEETMNIEYVMDAWQLGMRMVNEDGAVVRLILDNQNGTMTTVMEEEGKEPQAFRMRQRKVDVSDYLPEEDAYTVTRTGNTRTINGYHCEEYVIEHEDGTSTAWITDEIDIDYMAISTAFSAQARGRQGATPGSNLYGVEGFPIETTTVSEDERETTTARFSNIKTGDDINRKLLNLDGVPVQSLGF